MVCYANTFSLGWTLVMQRFNKDADFPIYYKTYAHPYGSLFSDYWIGMFDLQKLAAGKTVNMRVEMYAELKHEKIVQEYFNVTFTFIVDYNTTRITYTSYTGKVPFLQEKILGCCKSYKLKFVPATRV